MKRILIVGGGTAGWMTAAYLSKAVPSLQVAVVESARVNRIGVGEATFSTIRHFFDFLGLDEAEWLPRCGGGYKLGIKFENWSGDGSHFFHPFERWDSVRGFSLPEWWLSADPEQRGRFDTATFVSSNLCEALRSPRRHDGTVYALAPESLGETTLMEQRDQFPYAYHFDADKVAAFLADYAIARGVTHVTDDVIEVRAGSQRIDGVMTREHGLLEADYFVDCTGFRSLLLGGALGVEFESFADALPNNRAVALRVPRAEVEIMEPFTTAKTMTAGWRWTIPLYERNGYGYVYCDEYITPDEAERELRDSIPVPTDGYEANHIRMRIGRASTPWRGNCVGIGLSAAFVEPLESTGIFFIQQAIELFVRFMPSGEDAEDAPLRAEYNRRVRGMTEGVKHFLALHFAAARRNDSAYWRDLKTRIRTPEVERVLRVGEAMLLDDQSIYPDYHGFESYSWNTMLLGLTGGPRQPRPAIRAQDRDGATERFSAVRLRAEEAIAALPTCYDYIDGLVQNASRRT